MKLDIPALVREARQIKARQETDAGRLKEICAHLVEQGAGEYEGGDGSKAVVVCPSPKLKVDSKRLEELQKLAGESFAKLFDKVVSFKPAKGFREVAAAVLTPARARKIVEACEEESSPYVKIS